MLASGRGNIPSVQDHVLFLSFFGLFHSQFSQISLCQVSNFFKDGLPEKSIPFSILVSMKLVVGVYFFIKP